MFPLRRTTGHGIIGAKVHPEFIVEDVVITATHVLLAGIVICALLVTGEKDKIIKIREIDKTNGFPYCFPYLIYSLGSYFKVITSLIYSSIIE